MSESGIEPESSAYKAAAQNHRASPGQCAHDEDRTRLIRSTIGPPHQMRTQAEQQERHRLDSNQHLPAFTPVTLPVELPHESLVSPSCHAWRWLAAFLVLLSFCVRQHSHALAEFYLSPSMPSRRSWKNVPASMVTFQCLRSFL